MRYGRGGPNLGPECLGLFMLQFSSKFYDGLVLNGPLGTWEQMLSEIQVVKHKNRINYTQTYEYVKQGIINKRKWNK